MLKRYVLRSKVKIRDVTTEYDVWASWGSEREQRWETQRKWSVAQSGVVEAAWDHESSWPWGTEAGIMQDRRAVGMGHRLLVKKGERRRHAHGFLGFRADLFPAQEASTHDLACSRDYLTHRIIHGVPEGTDDIEPMNSFPMDSNLDMMGGSESSETYIICYPIEATRVQSTSGKDAMSVRS